MQALKDNMDATILPHLQPLHERPLNTCDALLKRDDAIFFVTEPIAAGSVLRIRQYGPINRCALLLPRATKQS